MLTMFADRKALASLAGSLVRLMIGDFSHEKYTLIERPLRYDALRAKGFYQLQS